MITLRPAEPVMPTADQRRRGVPRPLRRAGMAALAMTLGAGLAVAAAPAAGARAGGEAYVIQGLVGKSYDIVVDGRVVSPKAASKTIVGPLQLDAGTHTVALRDGGDTVVQDRFRVASGGSVDVVAHLRSDAGMEPELTTFRNDTGPVGPGKLRLTVAHTAAAPPADIKVDGKVLFSNVANAEALTVLVPAKTYSVSIVPAATNGQPILGPVDLPLKAGTLTRVFAIGNVTTKNMDAVVQSLPVKTSGSAAPGLVRTGDGGQAATAFVQDGDRRGLALGAVGAGLVLVAAGGAGARRLLRSRTGR